MSYRRFGFVLILFLVAACASGSTRNNLLSPEVADRGNSTLSLEVSAENPDDRDLQADVEQALLIALNQRSGFRGAVSRLPDSDYTLAVTILDAKSVGGTKRAMLGALAGRARLTLQAALYKTGTRDPIGLVETEAKSSGGTIFAGTNDDAIALAAEEITTWLAGRP